MVQEEDDAKKEAAPAPGPGGIATTTQQVSHPFGKGTKLEKAMGFLNKEFKEIREKLDIKLFECGFFKVEKETALDVCQSTIDKLAEDIGMLEKDILSAQAQIEKQETELRKLKSELNAILN